MLSLAWGTSLFVLDRSHSLERKKESVIRNLQEGHSDPSCPFLSAAAAAAKLLQSCPTLCDPIDGSPPGSPVPGILQARTLEWVAISFSNAWKVKSESEVAQSCPTLATPWTAAYQAPLYLGFSRQKYWSGVPLPSPLDTLYRQPTLEIISYLVTAFTCSLIQIIDKG